MTPSEKLSEIYRVCKGVKEDGYVEESVIDHILKIVTFDKHDYLSEEKEF